MSKTSHQFRPLILFPLIGALALIIFTAVFTAYRLQRWHLDQNINTHLASVQEVTQAHFRNLTKVLSGMLGFIKADQSLQQAWLRRDREAMLKLAQVIYNRSLIPQQVTHFYFIDPERISFLRVHKPDYFGDTISRYTLIQSEQSLSPASGIELGPLGTLTLRVVEPWRINGRITGFVELGVEIENLAPKLKTLLGSDLVFTVHKKFLDRHRWQEGLKMMGRTGQWDQFDRFVVFSQTLPKIPAAIGHHENAMGEPQAEQIFSTNLNNHNYRGGGVPLIDAGKNLIGDILVLKDITLEKRALRSMVVFIVATGGIVGLLLTGFFYFFIGRIERKMTASHAALEDEIRDRKQAEQALQKIHEELEERIAARTIELSRTNDALRQSEAKYSILVEGALMGVYIVQEGVIQFANSKYAAIFGYHRKDLVGRSDTGLIYKKDRDLADQQRALLLESQQSATEYEMRGIHKDGHMLWLLHGQTLIKYHNRPAIAGMIIDITARKKAEAQLQQSHQECQVLSQKLLSIEEAERQRIAVEIHDSVGQALSAIKFGLENAIATLKTDSSLDLKPLEAIIPLTQQTIAEVRSIVMALRPSILDDLGILATINWFCREFQKIYGDITISQEIAIEEADIPDRLKIVIYRILQEIINNVVKHSQAERIDLALKKKDHGIQLEVVDNGCGFDLDTVLATESYQRGFGLASIGERAKLSGGDARIVTRAGQGTRITINWPSPLIGGRP